MTTASGTRIWTLSGSLHPLRPGGLSLPGPSAASGDTEDSDAGFSGDGTEVVTANSDDGALKVYNAATGKQIATLNPGHGVPESVAFSPHGKLIAAGYSSGATIVWDAVTETEQTQLTGNTGSVSAVGFSGDGSEIVTASDDGSVRIWDARPRELQAAIGTSFSSGAPNPAMRRSTALAAARYSPWTALATPTWSPPAARRSPPESRQPGVRDSARTTLTVRRSSPPTRTDRWTSGTRTGQKLGLPSAIPLPVSAWYAAFAPTARAWLYSPVDGTVQVFSTVTGQRLHSITTSSLFISTMAAFSPDGRQILTATPTARWRPGRRHGHYLKAMGEQGKGINDLQFDDTGSEFVTTSYEAVVTVRSAHDRRRTRLPGAPHPARIPSPGRDEVALGCSDGSVRVIRRPGSRRRRCRIRDGQQRRLQPGRQGHRDDVRRKRDGRRTGLEYAARGTVDGNAPAVASRWVPGSLSQAQVNDALTGSSGWPSTP